MSGKLYASAAGQLLHRQENVRASQCVCAAPIIIESWVLGPASLANGKWCCSLGEETVRREDTPAEPTKAARSAVVRAPTGRFESPLFISILLCG